VHAPGCGAKLRLHLRWTWICVSWLMCWAKFKYASRLMRLRHDGTTLAWFKCSVAWTCLFAYAHMCIVFTCNRMRMRHDGTIIACFKSRFMLCGLNVLICVSACVYCFYMQPYADASRWHDHCLLQKPLYVMVGTDQGIWFVYCGLLLCYEILLHASNIVARLLT